MPASHAAPKHAGFLDADEAVVLGDTPSYGAAASAGVSVGGQVQVLYLTEAGDTTAINIDDIHQGQLGDCFLVSSVGELALTHAAAISNMIHVNADGTQTVTLYEDRNGHVPTWTTTSFKAVQVTVTDVFPTTSVNNGAAQDVLGNQKEIWPQVLEKAIATLDGGYGAIANGGNPTIVMEELTGVKAAAVSPASLSLAALQADIKAGDLITMDTFASSALPDNLVGSHAYMLASVTTSSAGVAMVNLRNPWGFDQPSAIPFAQLSKGIVEVDIGRVA